MRAAVIATAVLSMAPHPAWAHTFGERYEMPVPLTYFTASTAVAVALTFVVAVLVGRSPSRESGSAGIVVSLGPLLPVVRVICGAAGIVLLCIVIAAGLAGPPDPQKNPAPVLVWIVWWQGLTLLAAGIGNVWPALDPWRALFEIADSFAQRLGRAQGIALGWPYPQALGAWPAVILLLTVVWIEVLHPESEMPARVAWLAIAWSAVTLAGMVCFGAAQWRHNCDVFSVYFGMLGRFAPVAAGPTPRSIVLRPPGSVLVASGTVSCAMAAFIIAMLSTVLFDGLLSTDVMALAHRMLISAAPGIAYDTPHLLGTAGLIGLWLCFGAAYLLACALMAVLAGQGSTGAIARLYAPTLVPIAVAYAVAHNAASVLIPGQNAIPLLSDPLGRNWNLFGTAAYVPDLGIVDARFTWYLAASAIIAGHVISVWLAHRVARREHPERTAIASLPLLMLMILFTVVSLLLVADPLVRFGEPEAPRRCT